MESIKLNLSRKWRSHNFEGIVGQDLTIKMLKNSLYADHYFPVYLFAGQRGCGKTTTARVFASALNCDQLSDFQKKPRSVTIPCTLCVSCSAMAGGRHPDFIEIDAASHTGVDNIRQIIEAATLLPVMGCKKVYLIDEAHMLSKAAFNALLKILEDPPRSTLFILATTDPDKIIDTVRSRCFRLFFNAIVPQVLAELLRTVCESEHIAYEPDGFTYIVAHSQGSARDALNTLEQVRFAAGSVNKQSVLDVLGHIDDACLLVLLQKTYQGNAQALLSAWQLYRMERVSLEFAWRRLLIVCRALVWLHHGVTPSDMSDMVPTLREAIKTMPLEFIHNAIEALYAAEQCFMRTTIPQGILEMVLLQLCSRYADSTKNNNSSCITSNSTPSHNNEQAVLSRIENDIKENEPSDELLDGKSDTAHLWIVLLQSLAQNNDPLVYSLFSQGIMHTYDSKEKKIVVLFPARLIFFASALTEASAVWQPVLHAVFGNGVILESRFEDSVGVQLQRPSNKDRAVVNQKLVPAMHDNRATEHSSLLQKKSYSIRRPTPTVHEDSIDVSDCSVWPKTNLVLEYFPGTVTVVKEVQR
jgi:DNA polymerase-3 subunit gamma/tau